MMTYKLSLKEEELKEGKRVWVYDACNKTEEPDHLAQAVIEKVIGNPEERDKGNPHWAVVLIAYDNGLGDVIFPGYLFETKEDLIKSRSLHLIRQKEEPYAPYLWADEVPEGYDEYDRQA